MDHADARELLELAAAEPGGLDRLIAGDTPSAAAVAGHLAGCPDCADEFDRLRRSASLVRDMIRTTPPADLRDRTLAYVRAVGRERSAPDREAFGSRPVAAATQRRPTAGWVVGIAAAVLVSIGAGGLAVGFVARQALDDREAVIIRQGEVVEALATVTAWSLRVGGEPDARSVRLTSPAGGSASATILYSPSTSELVVVAEDLVEPSAGSEFRCWVEIDGQRRPVGRMFFGGGVSYWVGDVEAIAGLTDDATFGISVAGADGSGSGAEPVLRGEL
jgi:hypothetical protein